MTATQSRAPSTSGYERMKPGQQQQVGGAITGDDHRPVTVTEPVDELLVDLYRLAGVGHLERSADPHEVVLHVHDDQRRAVCVELEHLGQLSRSPALTRGSCDEGIAALSTAAR